MTTSPDRDYSDLQSPTDYVAQAPVNISSIFINEVTDLLRSNPRTEPANRQDLRETDQLAFAGGLTAGTGIWGAADQIRRAQDPATIANNIRRLDSNSLSDREAASRQLALAGVEALPQLMQTRDDPNSSAEARERSGRVIDQLRSGNFGSIVDSLSRADAVGHAARNLVQRMELPDVLQAVGRMPLEMSQQRRDNLNSIMALDDKFSQQGVQEFRADPFGGQEGDYRAALGRSMLLNRQADIGKVAGCLGQFLHRLGPHHDAEARQLLERGLQTFPGATDMLATLASVHHRSEDSQAWLQTTSQYLDRLQQRSFSQDDLVNGFNLNAQANDLLRNSNLSPQQREQLQSTLQRNNQMILNRIFSPPEEERSRK
jgi:hypothetical protein